MGGGSYEDLEVWKTAMDLVVECYWATREFPKAETYGLVSQMRRSSVSIASNIAEGQGRQSGRELMKHLSIATGSLAELETQIAISARLRYIDSDRERALTEKARSVGMMLDGLARSLREREAAAR
jgi:four helix bundle protein